jgi:hypothetical protein
MKEAEYYIQDEMEGLNKCIQDKTEGLTKRIDDAFTELDTHRHRMTFYPTECKDGCFNCKCGGAEATKDLVVTIHNV